MTDSFIIHNFIPRVLPEAGITISHVYYHMPETCNFTKKVDSGTGVFL